MKRAMGTLTHARESKIGEANDHCVKCQSANEKQSD